MPTVKRSDVVSQALIADLRGGRFAVGDTLPAEAEMCRRFGVSRSTVRVALSQLQDLGLIQRHQGAPTRVIATEVSPVYVHSMGASGDLMNFAGPTTRHIRQIDPIVADEDLAQRLDGRPGRRWLRIGQARYAKDVAVPIVWADVYLAREYSDIAADLPSYPGLIYTLLEQRHGVIIEEIQQTIIAAPLSAAIAQVLGAEAGEMALEITRRYRDTGARCWIVSINTQLTSSFKYEITLARQGAAPV